MSAVTLTSLVVAVVALAVTTVALLALLHTRRSVSALRATVRRLETPASPRERPASTSTDIAVRPVRCDAAAVVVPTPEQVYRATMERPLVRVAALSYGLRQALRPESRDRIAALVRREFRRRRKVRARAGRRAARMTRVGEPS